MNDFLRDWAPRVYRFTLRLTHDAHLAEDLTQEALLRAWAKRQQLRDDRAARVWLFQIAANLWRDHLRRARSPVAQTVALPLHAISRDAAPDGMAAEKDEVRSVLAALDRLPNRQREALYLHACEGLSVAEIADVLAIGTNAVKASLSLARKRMRELLPGCVPATRED